MQIGKLKIVPVLWADAVATASHQASDPSHLLSADREEMFYSAAAEPGQAVLPLVINVNWAAPVALDVLNIDRHNLSGTATVQHRLYLDGELVYDSEEGYAGSPVPAGEWGPGIDLIGATVDERLPSRSSSRYLSEPVYADRWEIIIKDPLNTDGQIRINRLPVGRSLPLENNFSWGGELVVVDSTEHLPTGGGGVQTRRGDQHRELKEALDWATSADRSLLLTELAPDMAQLLYIAAYPTDPAFGPPDGGVDELAYQMLAVRTNNISIRRSNALFGAAPLNFREV